MRLLNHKHILFKRFNSFIVLQILPKDKNRQIFAVTVCDCGSIGNRNLYKILDGSYRWCIDCYRKSRPKRKQASNANHNRIATTKHGLSEHPLYRIWHNVKQRCTNPNSASYPNYGGRGIKMCDLWLNNPHLFIEFCIANGWREGLQIDRIDNSGNYDELNCRFVTPQMNMSNTRRNKYCYLNNQKMTLTEASIFLGKTRSYLSNMIKEGRLHNLPENVKIDG